MKLPSITEFLDIKNTRDSTPSKVEEINSENLGPKEVLLTWESQASHEPKGFSKRFIRAFTIIGIFVGLLLIIMQEFFVILIIGSLVFVTQALMKLPQETVRYELSNHGVQIGDKLYYWNKLRRYFFIMREGVEVIAIDTIIGFPGRLFVSYQPQDKQKLQEILNKYLHFLEVEPKTSLDNAYDRVLKRFSLEDIEDQKE